MFRIEVQFKGPPTIEILASGALEAGILTAAKEAGALVLSELESFPFKQPTGNFYRSLYLEDTAGGVIVGSDAPYAEILEGGASPHVIYPRSASVLVFDGNSVGEASRKAGSLGGEGFVATKYVHHPGMPYPPQPFETTMNRLEGEIDEIFATVVSQIIDSASASQLKML